VVESAALATAKSGLERLNAELEARVEARTADLRRAHVRHLLRGLPKGEAHKIREPDGPPASWPRPAGRGASRDGRPWRAPPDLLS